MSLLPTVTALGSAAIAAAWLAAVRGSPPHMAPARRRAAGALVIATGAQGAHFLEESLTGFDQRLGEMLGTAAMPRPFFLIFNLTWLMIWVASVPGVRSGRAWSYFAAWFLAIAGTLNGVAHPALALAAGSYFPGLLTSPAIGAAGLWLGLMLHQATAPGRRHSDGC